MVEACPGRTKVVEFRRLRIVGHGGDLEQLDGVDNCRFCRAIRQTRSLTRKVTIALVRNDMRKRIDISAVFGLAFEHGDGEVEHPVRGSLPSRVVGVRSEDASQSGSARLQFLDRLPQAIPKLCTEFVDDEAQVLENAVDMVSDRRVWLVVYALNVGHADDRLNGRKLFEVGPARFRRNTELTRFVA